MFSVLFLLKEIFLVTCAGSEKDVIFFLQSSILKQLLSLCLLTKAELVFRIPSRKSF